MAARKSLRNIILILSLPGIFLAGCAHIQETPSSAKETYSVAQENLKKKRYEEAKYNYESILSEYPNSDLADNALFRLGYIACIQLEFENARDNFTTLREKYPKSEWLFDTETWLGLLDSHHDLYTELEDAKAQLGAARNAAKNTGESNDTAAKIEDLQEEINRLRDENTELRVLIETLEQ